MCGAACRIWDRESEKGQRSDGLPACLPAHGGCPVPQRAKRAHSSFQASVADASMHAEQRKEEQAKQAICMAGLIGLSRCRANVPSQVSHDANAASQSAHHQAAGKRYSALDMHARHFDSAERRRRSSVNRWTRSRLLSRCSVTVRRPRSSESCSISNTAALCTPQRHPGHHLSCSHHHPGNLMTSAAEREAPTESCRAQRLQVGEGLPLWRSASWC